VASDNSDLWQGDFGSCCKDLNDAMHLTPNSFFFVSEEGVLYQTVGYAQTEDGPGWYDQAVIYCPFSGHKLQDKDEIHAKLANAT